MNNIANAHVLVCDSAKFANQVLRTKKYALYAPAAEAVENAMDAKETASAQEPANLSTRSKKKHAAALRHAQRSTQSKGSAGAVRAQKPRSEAVGSGDVVNTEGLLEESEASLLTEEDEDVVTTALQTCSLPAADTLAPNLASLVSSSTAPTRVPLYVFKFGAVLVDPPRCGLDKLTLSLVAGYAHILYISCSPESLLRDLKAVRPCFS